MINKREKPTFRQPPLHEGVDGRALKEQILQGLADIETTLTTLTTMDEVENMTFSVMDTLPESVDLRERISEARKNGDKVLEGMLTQRQKEIYVDISGELALIAGIETDTDRVERENAEYRSRLLEKVSDSELDPDDPSSVLNELGMIRLDEEGREVFTYPEGVFPPHIDEKWQHYCDLVAQHLAAITSRNNGVSNDVTLISQLDAVRTTAHNNLSLAIKNFLELDNWDLEKCRRLVIKMRDSSFPTIETAEKAVTANEVLRLIAAVKKLSSNTD